MFDEMKDDELESELCAQAAHVNVGECHLVLLIGEFDRREGWAGWGIRSCAHWLNWRLGTTIGAAREQVRVGRALGSLPATRAAFGAGEISYSKVRAITRVADPTIEAQLVELARHATAAQLERIVREYRRCDPDEQEKANAEHRRRYLRHYVDAEGMVVLKARLDPDQAAIVLAAIELARQSASDEDRDVSAETPRHSHDQEDQSGDLSAETPEGVGGAQPVSPGPDHDLIYVDELETTSADALVNLCQTALSNGVADSSEESGVMVMVHVDEEVLKDPSVVGCSNIAGLAPISGHAAARLMCDGAVARLIYREDGKVEQEGATRTIPRTMRRALKARDRGCRFPGCGAVRFLHAHHVVFVVNGGPTKLSNLVLLCGRHHRLIHDGGWALRFDATTGRVRVFTPSGVEMDPVPALRATGDAIRGGRDPRISGKIVTYGGERFDLGMAIDGLLQAAHKIQYTPPNRKAS